MGKDSSPWTAKFKLKWSSSCKNLYIEMIGLPDCVSNCDCFQIQTIGKLTIIPYSCDHPKVLGYTTCDNWVNGFSVIEYGKCYKITSLEISDELRCAEKIAFSFEYTYSYHKNGCIKYVKIDSSCSKDEFVNVQCLEKCVKKEECRKCCKNDKCDCPPAPCYIINAPTGPTGSTGSIGMTGPTGNTGPGGDASNTGATGPGGPTGPFGTGPTGPTGMKGMTGQTGPTGNEGPTGRDGALSAGCFEYRYSSITVPSDPGQGNVRFNNADPDLATEIYIDRLDKNMNNLGNLYDLLAMGTSETLACVKVSLKIDNNTWVLGRITNITNNTGWYTFDFTNIVGDSGPIFNNSDCVIVCFSKSGEKGDAGATGPRGEEGVTGSTGATGMKGATGESGKDGIDGSDGETGPTGPTGIRGSSWNSFTGAPGALTANTGDQYLDTDSGDVYEWVGNNWIITGNIKGPTGATGPTGMKGNTGATGPQGEQGLTGATGAQGEQGEQGFTGATGTQGETGMKGATGDIGPTGMKGEQGFTGSAGATGMKGDQGETGSTGPQGTQGEQGFTGSTGTTGMKGSTGATGPQGKDGNLSAKCFEYQYSSNTTGSDPGQGFIRFNNSDPDASTEVYIDRLDKNGDDISAIINTIAQGTSSIPGCIKVTSFLDHTTWVISGIINVTHNGGWYTLDVSYLSGDSGPIFTNDEEVIVCFARTGDKGDKGDQGDTGPTGPQGEQGVTGPTGMKGATGETGPTGIRGSTWESATGAPSVTGGSNTGDQYLNTETGDTYEWNGMTWIITGNIRGPTGPTGATGDQGEQGFTGMKGATGEQGQTGPTGPTGIRGSTWDSATGAPSATGGNTGDQYLNTENGDTYEWNGMTWIITGNIRGPTGPTGATGSTGAQGFTGAQGETGMKGETGDVGATGATGPQGEQGFTGAQGATGMKGETGEQGQTGPTGPTGIRGSTWDSATGAPSVTGESHTGDQYLNTENGDVYEWNGMTWIITGNIRGPTGPTGETGAQGNTGATGPQGEQGFTGMKGENGEQGETGPTGPTGIRGSTWDSATGAPSATGGNTGDQYLNTENGDVYEWNGTTWIITGNIRGPTGSTGPKGDDGNDGATGTTGPTGMKGDDGNDGAAGATGPTGMKGDDGNDGAAGATGPSGPSGNDGPTGPTGECSCDGMTGFCLINTQTAEPEKWCFCIDSQGRLIIKCVCSNGSSRIAQIYDCGSSTSYLMIIVDVSGSIQQADAEQDVRDAVTDVVNALNAAGANVFVSILRFSGPGGFGGGTGNINDAVFITDTSGDYYRNVQTELSTIQSEITTGLADGEFGGFTNWEAAFKQVNDTLVSQPPTVTVFITDGNPTVSIGESTQVDGNNEDYFVYKAAEQANTLQNSGSRIISVLVGDNIDTNNVITAVQSDGSGIAFDNSVTNYIITTNPTNNPTGPVGPTGPDYYETDFDTLADDLVNAINSGC
jgi:Collagen triple helix repeat (20 copies)